MKNTTAHLALLLLLAATLAPASLRGQNRPVAAASGAAAGAIRLGADTLAAARIPQEGPPPMLELSDLAFSGTAAEGTLPAEEQTHLHFRIRNTGEGDAYNLRLHVRETGALAGLGYDSHRFLAKHFRAGETRTDSIAINGRTGLPTGRANFELFLVEARGHRSATATASLKTRESGVAKADIANDRIYKVGEREFRIQFTLQNTGSSALDSMTVRVDYPRSVYARGESQITVERLQPDEAKEMAFSFVKNRHFDENAKDIFTVTLADATGRTVGLPKSIARTRSAGAAATSPAATASAAAATSVMSEVDFDIPRSSGEFKNAHIYVLAFGNEKYAGNQNVPFAEKDALIFTQYCIHTFNIPAENIICRLNATGNQMKQALRDLTRRAKQDPSRQAEIIIYYSGHGIISKDKYGMADDEFDQYLLPVDVAGADASLSLSRKDIYAALNETPFKRASIFLDACNVKGDRAVAKVARAEWNGHVFVFASSLPNQTSGTYDEKGHGMFTYFLLKTIQDRKGKISYHDLAEEVTKAVEWQSEGVADKKQSPEVIASPQAGEGWKKWKFPE
jgi:hypothetical protein